MYTSRFLRRILLVMRRTQIYLDEELDGRLRAAAAEEGRSAAAIIRDAVRMYLSQRRPARWRDDPFLRIAGAFEGGPRDGARNVDHYLYGGPRGK